nr:unnamed protein product [Callosobruchus analis]
MEGYSLHL